MNLHIKIYFNFKFLLLSLWSMCSLLMCLSILGQGSIQILQFKLLEFLITWLNIFQKIQPKKKC